jgi:2-C-methyl-D-erythritol 4-phosphate cytidylyltransferase
MNSALIVAAGQGTRMGSGVDKLFLEVAGAPVIVHTWKVFEQAKCVDHIVLAVRPGLLQAFLDLAGEWRFLKPFTLVPGGAERQDSVWNGCAALPEKTKIVAIHDGARPCVTEALIHATIKAARKTGAAAASQRMVDTIKASGDGEFIQEHLDRSKLFAVQTPQTFQVEVIRNALINARERGLSLTDDTAACQLIGQPVKLVLTSEPNPKVTTPADLPMIASLLLQHAADPRL